MNNDTVVAVEWEADVNLEMPTIPFGMNYGERCVNWDYIQGPYCDENFHGWTILEYCNGNYAGMGDVRYQFLSTRGNMVISRIDEMIREIENDIFYYQKLSRKEKYRMNRDCVAGWNREQKEEYRSYRNLLRMALEAMREVKSDYQAWIDYEEWEAEKGNVG